MKHLSILVAASLSLAAGARRAEAFEFTRLVAHWADYSHPNYLDFIAEAKPEVVQVGFYGAHFWGLAHTPHGSGYPAHFPVRGHRECAAWFKQLNGDLHRLGARVVGHMNVKFLVGDPGGPEGPRGFFDFYRNGWDEAVLGTKPASDPMEFLEKDRSGQPISNKNYGIGGMREYWACLLNPQWREVLKAWVRFGLSQGVDGFMANYFYRHDCHCGHCARAWRAYLRERFTPEQLRQRFGIEDLAAHAFAEIVAWHDPAQSTPLRREMLRFSQIANKKAFDEVFVTYGRSLKPGLLVAQWNHLGDFNQINGDERCLLPRELWGRNEDYLWYSTGDAANFTDIASGLLGEATLQARYIRGAFDDKPFTLGKYENTRIRVAIAELAANGGAPMGFYTDFKTAEARREIVRYYGFLRKHERLFKASRSHAEVALLFPRQGVHQVDLAALARFKKIGQELLDAHVLFDVLPDDVLPEAPTRYLAVLDCAKAAVTNAVGNLPHRSRFTAPGTVRISASRPAHGNALTLHLVNYNRTEPGDGKGRGKGIADEKPIAAEPIPVELNLPAGFNVDGLEFLTPERDSMDKLPFQSERGRLRFQAPGFLVYGVVHIRGRSPE